MNLRIKISLFLLAAVLGIFTYLIFIDKSIVAKDFLVNLGTELIGIVVTVVFIEYLFDMRKHDEEATRLSWEILHELDYAIWVWQGGEKQFDYSELSNIMSRIPPSDRLATCTKNLLTRIGYKSDNTLRTKNDLLSRMKYKQVQYAIYQLKDLNNVPNYNENDEYCDSFIQRNVRNPISIAVTTLGDFLKLSRPVNFENILTTNSAIDQQEFRYFGR